MPRGATAPLAVGDVLEAVRGVRWPASQRVAGGPAGAHRARTRGPSVEFTEYRGYRQGDDVRRLDWKLLARTDRAYVRLTEDHAVLPTTVVLDGSASMAFPEATRGKWVHGVRLAIGLAAVAHATGDPVGVRVSGGPALAVRMRRGVVREIADALAAVAPRGTASVAPLIADVRARSRVAIISDFLGDTEAMLSAARAARARGCDVYAVHIVDGWELNPPRTASLVADPETPELRRPLVRQTRGAYQNNFARWRTTLAREWLGAGVDYTLTVSGEGGDTVAHAVRSVVLGSGGLAARGLSDPAASGGAGR
jgi:uncharacterized protein (DUF58 family)